VAHSKTALSIARKSEDIGTIESGQGKLKSICGPATGTIPAK
tara:strand:- start:2234 stop:2359 length:126 start_codon:yes stop_codon:yes gene_type:complete